MTLEEFADLLRTPLPGPPQLTDEQLARLKAMGSSMIQGPRAAVQGLAGLLPEQLPVMPEWLRRYSTERGLLPPDQGASR